MIPSFKDRVKHGTVAGMDQAFPVDFMMDEDINNLEEHARLFDDSDYGEGFLATAKNLSDVSQLDRIIMEDCKISRGKVVAPHFNYADTPYYLKASWIMRQGDFTQADATRLADIMTILDFTADMAVKTLKSQLDIDELEKLATAAGEAEYVDPEDVTLIQGIVSTGEKVEDSEIDEYGREERVEMITDEHYAVPDEFAYHVLGSEDQEPVKYFSHKQNKWIVKDNRWFARQPAKYRKYIKSFFKIASFEDLKKEGKKMYTPPKEWTKEQISVFWTGYRIKKARLEKKYVLTEKAAKTIAWMKTPSRKGKKAKAAWICKHLDSFTTYDQMKIWETYHKV